jgi:hypothetical protein
MNRAQLAFRYLFFSAWAVLMTALTYVLGAPSLKVLRHHLGRWKYWSLTTAIGVALVALKAPALAVAFMSLVILMGIFTEFEDMDIGLMPSALFTLLVNGLLGAGAFAFWVSRIGPNWSQTLLESVETALKPLNQISPKVQLNFFDLMLQLPSIVIIMWTISIYLAVLMEDRLRFPEAAASSAKTRPSFKSQLGEVRMPDACVWIFIVSLLGAFGDFKMRAFEVISVNAMNVCLVLFFFQGAAVAMKLFAKIRMGWFWQMLFMILIVVHLFLFVSLVGLLDYWFDFRTRLAKPPQVGREEA